MRWTLIFLNVCIAASTAFARLGDTQDQAEERYGLPKKMPSRASTLIDGARELTFEYQGWRIRCALLPASDGKEYVVREQYAKIVSVAIKAGGPLNIRDFECEAVRAGEAGNMTWKRKIIGDLGKDVTTTLSNQFALNLGLSGTIWVRDDGAVARLDLGGSCITLDLPQARKYEAELKAIKENKAKAAVPKF
jgi:hypothetical protein